MQIYSKKLARVWLLFLFAALLALFLLWRQLPDKHLHFYFLDVGQGDAIFIKTSQNHQILVDGGPKNFVMEELAEIMPFFDKTIDLVVLSHPHADHIDGLVEVLKRYEVEAILFSAVDFGGASYEEFLQEIQKKEIETFVAEAETDFRLGNLTLDIVYPRRQMIGESIDNLNNSSVAMRALAQLKNGRSLSVFLTGDIEKEVEAELVAANIDLSADILKSPHHGSRSSSTLSFLSLVNPEIVVIQSGEDNSFGHPHPEVLARYQRMGVKKIIRNDLEGRIDLAFD